MMRVDIHTHAFSARKAPEVIAALAKKTEESFPIHPCGDGTMANLLAQEAEDGFERFAICPIATKPEQFAYMEKYLGSLRDGRCGEEARARIIPCVSLHPDDMDAGVHIRRLVALGAKMVKLHPYFQKAELDSERMIRLLKTVTDAGLPVLCHTGYDITTEAISSMASPRQILNAYRAVPGLRMICAHCASLNHPEAAEMLLGRQIYVDVAFQPSTGTETVVRRFAEEHPQEYVLFGSDWPWMRPAEHRRRVLSWNISKAREEAIFGGNAIRLLGL